MERNRAIINNTLKVSLAICASPCGVFIISQKRPGRNLGSSLKVIYVGSRSDLVERPSILFRAGIPPAWIGYRSRAADAANSVRPMNRWFAAEPGQARDWA